MWVGVEKLEMEEDPPIGSVSGPVQDLNPVRLYFLIFVGVIFFFSVLIGLCCNDWPWYRLCCSAESVQEFRRKLEKVSDHLEEATGGWVSCGRCFRRRSREYGIV